jgi:molybdate transport system ATP-binding protein
MTTLEVDITKRLGSFSLDVSFAIERPDEIMALLGPSGCGKSMTLKCIAGIERPDSGRIVLGGRTLFDSGAHVDLPPQQRRVGYLFQSYALFPTMTVEQNVRAGAAGATREERSARAAREIAAMRLEGLEHRKPAQLSGGQQQRCAMARILASDPELILLDEPFSALDGYLRWQLELELTDVLRGFPGGAVYVSHNRDEVYRMCDTVCVLDRGRSDAKVGVHELFASPATLAAALISGCKNVSRARVAGPGLLLCDDWGVTLETSLPVPEGVTHVGIRAHYFQAHAADDGAASAAGRNAIPCAVERVIDSTFSTIVMARTPGGASLRYECEKDAWAALGNPAQLVLVAPPQTVMPLVSAGNGETPDTITLDNTRKGGAPRA